MKNFLQGHGLIKIWNFNRDSIFHILGRGKMEEDGIFLFYKKKFQMCTDQQMASTPSPGCDTSFPRCSSCGTEWLCCCGWSGVVGEAVFCCDGMKNGQYFMKKRQTDNQKEGKKERKKGL